jgi:hypothetical protein
MIPASVLIYLKVPDHLTAIILNALLLIFLWITGKIIMGIKRRKRMRSALQNKRSAKVVAYKNVKQNLRVLQLEIDEPGENYTAGFVETTTGNDPEKYANGQNIEVFVNPSNKYDIFLPEKKQTRQERSNRPKSGTFVWVFIVFSTFFVPFLIHLLNPGSKLFKDLTYISVGDNQEKLWEVRYESPKKMYIKIIDPTTGKTIKKIKDKKESDLDPSLNIVLIQQNQNTVLVGMGNTPVFDVYNSESYEKISDIQKLEQSKKLLNKGIVEMREKSINSLFVTDYFVEMVTADGIKCFYDVQKDLLFESDKELKTYIDKTDKDIMSAYLFAFVLSPVKGSDYQEQLYCIRSESPKYSGELLENAGQTNFDQTQFNKSKRYNCKKCSSILLSEETFLKSNLTYFDTTMAVIVSLVSMKKDDYEKITAIDTSGKTLFVIQGTEFPNYDSMVENDYHPHNYNRPFFMRLKNRMIIDFDEYGAIAIDLSTGKQLWKYEP